VSLDPLFLDASRWSRQRPEDWPALAAAGLPWIGVCLKASEGRYSSREWFEPHWRAIREAGGDRFGVDWFRGAYLFARLDTPWEVQADTFLRTVGPPAIGDLFATIDVEEGDPRDPASNAAIVRASGPRYVEDIIAPIAAKLRRETGHDVTLYAGGWYASLGLRSRLGCDWLWWAAYTRELPASWYGAAGWTPDRLLWWQYDGSGNSNGKLVGYPTRAPIEHGEDVDISVLTLPGGIERLRSLLWAERPSG
jgi:GH25 family lysozyme M1 (1,4-beta-N-acetylmuramidase)